MQQVTGAYLDGIQEGRSFLKQNPTMTTQEMKRCKENAQELMRQHSYAMKDCFRGERDFWANQIKQRGGK